MKIYIITGEKSGDQHASQIVHELKKQFIIYRLKFGHGIQIGSKKLKNI